MRKLFLFLSVFILTTSASLMGMESSCLLPDPAKELVIKYLSGNPGDLCNLSLVCRNWAIHIPVLQKIKSRIAQGIDDSKPVGKLNPTSLDDYRKAILRYMVIYEKRNQPGFSDFKQDEFIALQDFIIHTLCNELGKRDEADIINYIYIPLILNINFHNITDMCGDTPLHIVCATGQFLSMPLLVSAGANINATNIAGKTPEDFAEEYSLTTFQKTQAMLMPNKLKRAAPIPPK